MAPSYNCRKSATGAAVVDPLDIVTALSTDKHASRQKITLQSAAGIRNADRRADIITSSPLKENVAVQQLLDLSRYPLDRPQSTAYEDLVLQCQSDLDTRGMFNLDGFVHAEAIRQAAAQLQPLSATMSYVHQRSHNVYFLDKIDGLRSDHPALRQFQTSNHTLCGDQLDGTIVQTIYEWPPLVNFLARVMRRPQLFLMADPLARLNVMEYRHGETLNWHFDRAKYTTTLLIQAAQTGGAFEYRHELRSDSDPNYSGVARVLDGTDDSVQINPLQPGTLNVFAGRNTLHRVSTVSGATARVVAVFSYYDKPSVQFSESERIGFYGRAY